ncbi:MAG: TetR/AcrR family transcriptional regulator [Naasia sp.]
MHFVSESATGVRERRKAATRDDLTRVARRMTAEHGLQGFTVEELCDVVGVSRRTFFNYFGGKEEAVVGQNDEFIDEEAAEAFVRGGSPSEVGTSADLLPALVGLAAQHIRDIGTTAEDAGHLFAAIKREPKLFERFASVGERRHRIIAELVERREGLEAGDPRAEAAVHLLDSIVHWSGARFIAPGNSVPFHELIEQSLDLVLAVMPCRHGLESRKDTSVTHH